MSDDKVHPSSKPTTTTNTSLPSTKPQLHGATRPTTFRSQHNRNRNRDHDSSICCTLCTYLCLLLFLLLVLIGVAAIAFYYLFRPHPPTFTLTSLTITSSASSSPNFDLTLSSTNPNSKITFSYQPTIVSILAAGDTTVAGGTVPAFEQRERNTTVLVASVDSSGMMTMRELRNDAVSGVKVKMVTKVEAKMGPLKTPRVGITVLCDGVRVDIPAAGKKEMVVAVAAEPAAEPTAAVEEDPTTDVAAEPTAATGTVKTSGCEVDVRFKVWKWIV